jgi:hypothetical protein
MKVGILEFDVRFPGRTIVVLVDDDYVNSAANMQTISSELNYGASEVGTFVIRKTTDVLDFEFNLEEVSE